MPKILVTGATGFVGSAVTRHLVDQGQDVAILLRSSSNTALLGNLLSSVTPIYGDMSNLAKVKTEIADFAPSIIGHLAWGGVNGEFRNDSVQVDNLHASLDLYALGRDLGVQRFVGLGSQAEYGALPNKISEDAPTHPTTLYGAAKLSTYFMLDRLSAQDGIDFAWLRLFSSYGPGDNPKCIIPYLILRLLKGEKPSLTAGEQMWDFIHVDDVAAAIAATLLGQAKGVFNLGSGTTSPLKDVITRLRDSIDPSLPLGFGEIAYRPDQVMHLEADISALTAATGWKPVISLDDGIRQTVEWYRNSF